MRPFSLADLSISFPYVLDTKVSTRALFMICVIIPGVIIFLVCVFFVPGSTPIDPQTIATRSLKWRRKLWEWNVGWLGLGLALVIAVLITDGMKNLFGKPRPDLLSRCDPDLSRVREHAVGGYSGHIDEGLLLVLHTICRNREVLDDGFRSFPSGHASSEPIVNASLDGSIADVYSVSWAGMTYLTLFLCAKFSIAVPLFGSRLIKGETTASMSTSHARENGSAIHLKNHHHCLPSEPDSDGQSSDGSYHAVRNQAAAPPIYLLIVAFVPIGVAIYISTTRYSDFRHHGFDILFGALLGFSAAWFAFRWYHLPVQYGAGWSWGARSRNRAFGVGFGIGSHAGDEGWSSAKASGYHAGDDVELGQVTRSNEAGIGAAARTRPVDHSQGLASTAGSSQPATAVINGPHRTPAY